MMLLKINKLKPKDDMAKIEKKEDPNPTSLLHHKSIYSNKLESIPNLEIDVTLKTPDDLENLVRYIDYGILRKKILPKKTLFPPKSIDIKIPRIFARRTVIEQSLKLACGLDDIWNSLSKINPKIVNKANKLFLNGLKMVCINNIKNMNWNCVNHSSLQRKNEWKCKLGPNDDLIEFNPYLISEDSIYLIALSKGNPERIKLIKILLAQYCLARKLGYSTTKIGIIIPGKPSTILTEDLSDWIGENHFWKVLEEALVKKRLREARYRATSFLHTIFKAQLHSYVGRHVFKEDLEYHITSSPKRSYQFFLTARSYDVKSDPKYESKIKFLVEENKANIFIHAPYIYDMSKPTPKLKSALVNILEVADRMGVVGVVIHVGKGAKNEKEAVIKMKETLIEVMNECKSNTKLLIETPAKQKGEVLSGMEDFANFWLDLPEEIKLRTGVCVDTCHVFSAGYMPLEYLEYLEEKKVPVDLIHYNDSEFDKGCCLDRHAPIGVGYIGFEGMYSTLQWAIKNKVGCVFE